MEGLLSLFILIGLIQAISRSAEKKRKAASASASSPHKPQPAQAVQAVQAAAPSPAPAAETQKPVQTVLEGQSRLMRDPDTARPQYMGSMVVDSDEGEDTCDPALMHDRELPADLQSVYAHQIGAEHRLDLSPDGLWQGVVMSEILTRPAERNKRKGASWRN